MRKVRIPNKRLMMLISVPDTNCSPCSLIRPQTGTTVRGVLRRWTCHFRAKHGYAPVPYKSMDTSAPVKPCLDATERRN